jgi:hypothetical protein
MKNDFIPQRDGDLDTFEENLAAKLGNYAAVLGLNAAEVAESLEIINKHRADYSLMISKRNESKSSTENTLSSQKKALAEIRRITKLIKASKSYTAGIGDDLGIIGSVLAAKNTMILKPVLSGMIEGNEVQIRYKKNKYDGIRLYSRRGAETEFTEIGKFAKSPVSDRRANLIAGKPEEREYYAYFLINDRDTGQKSDSLKMIVL